MNRRTKIYLTLFIICILGIVYAELSKPKQINWFASYSSYHKIPFGAYIFKDLLKSRFDSVVSVDRPPYEYLQSDDINGTYLFFNDGLSFGEAELELLLEWTSKGNTLIMASTNYDTNLLDTLRLKTSLVSISDNFQNEFNLVLTHPELRTTQQTTFDKATTLYHFSDLEPQQTKVVGVMDKPRKEIQTIEDSLINIVKKPFGQGQVILSTFPQAFTNYFILKGANKDYTAGLMSYIDPDKAVYLDAYYKSGKVFYTSPMYLFLNNPHLKWFYYLLLFGVVVYIIFEGKRKQRAIPVVEPLKNQTLDYTRTIANLYYERSTHSEMALLQIQHFFNHLRTELKLPTDEWNELLVQQVAEKSSNELEEVKALFQLIKHLKSKNSASKEELEELNKRIEQFKHTHQ